MLHTFILTVPGHEQRVKQLSNALLKYGIQAQQINVLNHSSPLMQGQERLRLTMKNFFQTALAANLERVLVLEDDAVLHRHFGARLQQLLSDRRCGNYILNEYGSGILMLGATIWKEAWDILDKFGRNETGLCRNICSKTTGSFAVLYQRVTYETILNWLNTTVDERYDHVFTHLSRLGHPVRFAVPNLVIRTVTFTSFMEQTYENNDNNNLEKRAPIHRWNLSEYMFS